MFIRSDKLFGEDITNNTRPDYRVDNYDNSIIIYSNVVGEIKTAEANKNLTRKDLCRVALYIKELLDKNNLEVGIAFQAVGKHNFYTQTLLLNI